MEGGSELIDNFDEKLCPQAAKARTTLRSLHKNADETFTLPACAECLLIGQLL